MTEYTAHRLMVEAKEQEIKDLREIVHRREAVIKILERELEAIGAGGVEPLKRRVTYVCPVCAASLERHE